MLTIAIVINIIMVIITVLVIEIMTKIKNEAVDSKYYL